MSEMTPEQKAQAIIDAMPDWQRRYADWCIKQQGEEMAKEKYDPTKTYTRDELYNHMQAACVGIWDFIPDARVAFDYYKMWIEGNNYGSKDYCTISKTVYYADAINYPAPDVDVPVWVRHHQKHKWSPKHSAGKLKDGNLLCWINGSTSHSTHETTDWIYWTTEDPEREAKKNKG